MSDHFSTDAESVPPVTPPAQPTPPARVGPDHRDLYLLILGLAFGIILGPWVLGRVSPQTWESWFLGATEAHAALEAFEQQTRAELDKIQAIGVTDVALAEHIDQRSQEKAPLLAAVHTAEQQHAQRLHGTLTALLAAVLVFMAIESLLDPHAVGKPLRIRNRIAAARYALMAIWLAMFIASADTLKQMSLAFFALAVAVGLLAALVPLGKRRAA